MASPKLQIDDTSQDEWRRFCGTGQLYAVVDSCDEPSVPKKVDEAGPAKAVSLYRGEAMEQYSTVAPYLMHVDSGIFDWIVSDLWAAPWGIFVYAEGPLESLRTHFRRYLTVQGPHGKKYLFRFYDPSVLPSFLESCNDRELTDFFGPVRGYGAKKQQGVTCLRLRRQ